MKKLLITGFEPFGGESINPSWEAVLALPEKIGGYELEKMLVPVEFNNAADLIIKKASEISPEVVLSIGQAGGRDAVTPELLGINLRYASIPDNKGCQPKDEEIIHSGERAFFSTLPMRKIAEAINERGITSRLSYSAGAYVCNDVIYTCLSHFEGTKTRFGFIHVPYSKEQGREPSMPLEKITEAIEIAIESLG
jgi:pyroglutamyl-peptidase